MSLMPKRITFVMCLKDRAEAAHESIKSLVNKDSINVFNFIISEDKSKNLLDLSDFEFKKNITHYVIDTGQRWNRSMVCNFGFKRAVTKYVSSWDADFLFPENFTSLVNTELDRTNFNLSYLKIQCTETDSCTRRGTKFKAGDLYGGMYIYDTLKLHKIKGYDESFTDYGWEEKDFNMRYSLQHSVVETIVKKKNFVYHKSHNEAISGSKRQYDINKQKFDNNIRNRNFIVNKDWGNSTLVSQQV